MGTPLRHSNFYRHAWLPAVAKADWPVRYRTSTTDVMLETL